jgi:hypothetical protein
VIRAKSVEGMPFGLEMVVDGVAGYLDNWAIIELAKGDSERRNRFVRAMARGGDLLFSSTNAVEITGPQGSSSQKVRAFLNDLSVHWVLVELDARRVMDRERQGSSASAPFHIDLARAYVANRLSTSQGVHDLSEDFFRLGYFLDWLLPQRASFRSLPMRWTTG